MVGSFTDRVLARLGQQIEELDSSHAALARATAAAMVDSTERSRSQQPTFVGRRLAVVTTVNAGPPLTADVTLGTVLIPEASPQSTYRPIVGDLVWLEFSGPDAHISPPLTTAANRAWNTLTLGGAWAIYNAAPYPPTLSYWRDPVGMVHLRGAVHSGASGTVIATLPPDNRPPYYQSFKPLCASAVGVYGLAGIDVAPAGTLTYVGPPAPRFWWTCPSSHSASTEARSSTLADVSDAAPEELELPPLASLPISPMMEAAPYVPRAVKKGPPPRPVEAKVFMLVVLLVAAFGFLVGTMVTGRASLPAACLSGVLLLVLIWSALPVLLRRSR